MRICYNLVVLFGLEETWTLVEVMRVANLDLRLILIAKL